MCGWRIHIFSLPTEHLGKLSFHSSNSFKQKNQNCSGEQDLPFPDRESVKTAKVDFKQMMITFPAEQQSSLNVVAGVPSRLIRDTGRDSNCGNRNKAENELQTCSSNCTKLFTK